PELRSLLHTEWSIDPARKDRCCHSVAHLHPCDARTNRNHFAGTVGDRNDIRLDRQGIAPAEDRQLSTVEGVRTHPDQGLPQAGLGLRVLAHRQARQSAAILDVVALHARQGSGGDFAGRFLPGNDMDSAMTPNRFAGELRRWRQSRRWSQLELALRAGTTQRHLSFIEHGRSTPGRTLVVRLAESLELTLRERNALLLAAGYAPIFSESQLDDRALRPVRDAIERILEGHLPYPAVVVRPHGELVAANAAVDILTAGAAPGLLQSPTNVLRLAVHPMGMARRVLNLAEWGRHIVENLRARALRSPDRRLDRFIAELESYLPPAPLGPQHLGFAVPLRLQTEEGE